MITHRFDGLAVLVLVVVLLLSGVVYAADQEELLGAAERAEANAEVARALELYRQAEAVDPAARLSRRARTRITWIEERSEGGFVPLIALLRARAALSAAPSPAAVAAFTSETRGFPAGLVRRESLELIADTWLARLNRPIEALDAYLSWAGEPDISEAERQLAESGAALARARLGRLDEAIADLDRAGLGARAEARFLVAQRVGRFGSAAAWIAIALWLAAIVMLGRPRRMPVWRDASELGTLTIVVLGVPMVLVRLYDRERVFGFAAVIGASAVVIALSLLAAGSIRAGGRTRRLLSGLSAMAVVAAAFIACHESGMLLELMLAARGPQ